VRSAAACGAGSASCAVEQTLQLAVHCFQQVFQLGMMQLAQNCYPSSCDGDASRSDISRPAMAFYPGAELANDSTNGWGCVQAAIGMHYLRPLV
jgi:hypothetical protein